jgi:hypothetical protein
LILKQWFSWKRVVNKGNILLGGSYRCELVESGKEVVQDPDELLGAALAGQSYFGG